MRDADLRERSGGERIDVAHRLVDEEPSVPGGAQSRRDHLDPRPVACAFLGRKHVNRGENRNRRVVGKRSERVGEDLRVLGCGSRDVERVAQRAVRREHVRKPRLCCLGERLEWNADHLGPVGDDVAGAAGDRDHPEPTGWQRAGARQQAGGHRKLLDRVDADDSELPQCGVDETVVAHERAGVGERDLRGESARPDLEHHDRLLELGRPLGQPSEPLGVTNRLDEHRECAYAVVLEHCRGHVDRVDHRLVARRDHVAEPDVLRAGERGDRVGRRTALRDDGDAAGHDRHQLP